MTKKTTLSASHISIKCTRHHRPGLFSEKTKRQKNTKRQKYKMTKKPPCQHLIFPPDIIHVIYPKRQPQEFKKIHKPYFHQMHPVPVSPSMSFV